VAKNRIPVWRALIVGAIGLPLAAILGLWTYKSVTTPILHTDPEQDGKHFVRGHEVDCAEHRADLRGTAAKSVAPVINTRDQENKRNIRLS
jgi:hypothetical protein